jgi:hypothetical protein
MLKKSVTFFLGSGFVGELNMANDNASLVAAMAGVRLDFSEGCGDIPLKVLPETRRRILVLINSPKLRKPWTADSAVDGGQGITKFFLGRDEYQRDEYLVRKLKELSVLIEKAQIEGVPLLWA